MSQKTKSAGSQEKTRQKSLGRFNAHEFVREYVKQDSEAFKFAVTVLYSAVQGYYEHRKDARWAKCCSTLERRVKHASLGHPENEMIKLSELVRLNKILNRQDLEDYILKVLPKNEKDEILLPQINMKHPENPDLLVSVQPRSLLPSPSKSDDEITKLKAKIDEFSLRNDQLTDQVKTHSLLLSAYEEQNKQLMLNTERLESIHLAGLTQVEKVNEKISKLEFDKNQILIGQTELLAEVWASQAQTEKLTKLISELKSRIPAEKPKECDDILLSKRYEPDYFELQKEPVQPPKTSNAEYVNYKLNQLLGISRQSLKTPKNMK